MLRIIQTSSVAQAKSYYTSGLAREDYYAEGQECVGRWGGQGARRLGLEGPVDAQSFAALCDNQNPVTGERLTEFETDYWEHRTFIDRWVPVISSSVLLWGGISLLALAAIRRRRARDAERLARWGVEEGELANPFGELPEEAPEVEAEIDAGPAAEGAPDDWPPRKPDPKAWRRR